MNKIFETGLSLPVANRKRAALLLRQLYLDIAACFLAVRWAYTASTGLLAPGKFHIRLSRYPFWREMADELVLMIPLLQAVMLGLLAFSKTRAAGLWGSFGMMCLSFIVPRSVRDGVGILTFDLILAALALTAALIEAKRMPEAMKYS